MKTMSSILVFGLIFGVIGSLRRDDTEIRSQLIKEKPLGSVLSEVERWLKEEKKLAPSTSEVGFLKQTREGNTAVGVKSIRVKLGDYWSFPFSRTSVVAFFGFDAENRLIEVWIWKTADSL